MRPSVATLERLGLVALVLALLVGFAIYPSFPTYDSVYSLVWGREIVNLSSPSFEAFRAPTEHPLGIAVGMLLTPLGGAAGRAFEFLILTSYAALIVGVYRLGRQAFTPLVGVAAAINLLSRFDFANLAIRGYIDVPYIAALVWAAVFEYERPRRGGIVWVLLAAAGLMRPEAWLLAGAYWLWMVWGDRAHWLRRLAYALAAPLIWLTFDLVVTGDPLFSFHATSETVGELGRSRSPADLPAAMYTFFGELVKPPVIAAGAAGLALALWFAPRRSIMPLVLFVSGLATFIAIGLAGLAVIDRYLVVASAALCIFAGFAVAGFTVLRSGVALRRAWTAVAAVAVVGVAAFTLANTLRLQSFRDELAFRTDFHDSLVSVLESNEVRERRAAGCGPISTPTHKIVPDVRLALDLSEAAVVSRNDPDARARAATGIALFVKGRRAMELNGFDADTSALTEVPPEGFERIASSKYFTAFALCTDN